jgi:hypothetical protein
MVWRQHPARPGFPGQVLRGEVPRATGRCEQKGYPPPTTETLRLRGVCRPNSLHPAPCLYNLLRGVRYGATP